MPTPQDLRPLLKRMVEGGHTLRTEEVHAAIGAMLDGNVTDVEIAALLTALAQRGETVDEVAGMVIALRERLMPLSVTEAERAELGHGHGAGGPRVGAALGAGGLEGGHQPTEGVEGKVDAEVFGDHTGVTNHSL